MSLDAKRLRLSRRILLESALGLGSASLLVEPGTLSSWLSGLGGAARAESELAALLEAAPKARFWTSTASPTANCQSCHVPSEIGKATAHEHGKVLIRCLLCAHSCVLAEGERGMCRARIHLKGELRTLVWGRPMAIQVDPIEKKPFYHFLPGAQAYSLATSGCPLRCKFCQNWEISQARPEDYDSPVRKPDELVAAAAGKKAQVIAFTYNEPTVFAEYLLEIAQAARKRGVRSVLISCGYMQEEPLAEMCQVLSAIKVDLKGYSAEFYKSVCGAELAPVLRSIKQIARSKVHLELVNLVVPSLNDSEKALGELIRWVAGELGPDVPVHFTRFHPDYQLPNLSPTPVTRLERARDLALRQGLRYAYVGNVPGHPGNSTYCPKCKEVVIERSHFFVSANRLQKGRCPSCQEPVAGVWA
ncbi:MAG: AmmeMemoRadiSam system radical SAM enzyme [Deltaproteobacteria bacterium]|nr:AmmeMemoRadiSam system radical SAM enzyme [Deltaproteobacteria bacterium]